MTKNCLDVLFQQYYECLVLFAESYVGDVTMAEDMVQDVFLTLLSRPDFSKVEYTRSYLYSCVKNNCVDYLRKLRLVDPLNVKLFDAIYYIGDFDGEDKEAIIHKVEEEIEKLPIQRREILKLSVYQDMSYPQIAEVTGLSINTIKTHMKKAYQELREKLYEEHQNFFLLFILSRLRYNNQ
ncbi:RNA polymerase sigma factor [Butyricimonas virosa]|uniref:RNA polymerase sigma factor n=1 Tax=Butyricimonas virosa TaxID=544645 RepID=UPI0026669187|nr:sigma-70 family RNA polymerase sigma factor [Butyricimonas virosa]